MVSCEKWRVVVYLVSAQCRRVDAVVVVTVIIIVESLRL